MLISIIIPVYNTKEYLEKCVYSILDKAVNDYEILLIDDGSTDGESGALCDRLAEENPEYIRVVHQSNKGLGGARNTGILQAKGEYLFFVDSDDTLTDGAISVLREKLLENHPDVLSFNLFTDDGEGNSTFVKSNFFESDKPFSLITHPEFLISLPNACNRIWKKSLFVDNNIYFPDRVWYEDLRTCPKIFALAKSIATMNDGLYIYLQREDSIMHSAKLERNREIMDALDDLIDWYKQNGLFEMYKNELCRLCVEHVFVAAQVRVLKADTKHPLLKAMWDYTKHQFPKFRKNKYISEFPIGKRVAFELLFLKQYWLLRILFRIK